MTDFVTIEGRALKQAMRLVTAVIERRNTIPILSHARLTLDADGLNITSTDLDIEATVTIDVIDGAGEWSACLPANVLAGIARVAGIAPVRIEPNGVITIDGDVATYEVQTLPASDFPELTGTRGKLIETFTNGMLAETLDKVSWCISTEETRYYLNGVCWQSGPNGLRFVATDGHRMAICRYSTAEDEASERIIPRKTVGILSKHFAGKDVAIFATNKETVIEIAAPGMTVRTKLIDGTFPNVDRVIPREDALKYDFVFRRDEIIPAIERATAITGWKSGRAIRFSGKDGRVAIDQNSTDFGIAKVATSAQWPRARDLEAPSFGFNSRYAREVIANCQGSIILRMTDSSSPFTITDADETMTRVLMPMRV
jgi:DNA polymerase III subunit beta